MVDMSSCTNSHRVWVTGIGLVTSLGGRTMSTWTNLRAGRSAASWVESDSLGSTREAGYYVPGSAHGPLDHVWEATHEAIQSAKLDIRSESRNYDPERVAVVLGMSKGEIRRLAWHREHIVSNRAISSLPWTMAWPSGLSSFVGQTFGFLGPRLSPIAACATGVVAALRAFELIRRGECDIALAGAGDSQNEPFIRAAFRSMRVLARTESDPCKAVRPLDRARTGFLPGEGAAVLVLERAEHAQARGVAPVAELAGGALASEAHHITNQNPDPTDLARLVQVALARSAVEATEIDHVNLHGTATRSNDPLECRAIRRALGTHTDQVACCANKAQIGHLLGAAGAGELAITCLTIRDQFVPPTLNLDNPDSACDLDATPHVGRARPVGAALKLSLGFGGHMAVVVLRKP